MVQVNRQNKNIWEQSEEREALIQIADLCQKALSLPIEVSTDGSSFHSSKQDDTKDWTGVLAVFGRLVEEPIISVRIELVRSSRGIRVDSCAFFKQLANLGEKVRLIPPQEETSEEASLWVELNAKASPMSLTRASGFLDQLKQLNELSRLLQAELPTFKTHPELMKVYKGFENTLAPVHPLDGDTFQSCGQIRSWAQETLEYLSGATSVAVVSPFFVTLDFAVAMLAQILIESGTSMGLVVLPAIGSKNLLDIAGKAPGILVVPAMKMSLGTSPYEVGNEMQSLLSALSSANRPVVFTGTMEELQAVFAGGQGGRNDPLLPIVSRVPDVSIDLLVPFAIETAGRQVGGLTKTAQENLLKETLEALEHLSPAEQRRILPTMARRTANTWYKGGKEAIPSSVFVSKVSSLSESLAGLSPRPRVRRSPQVQERFTGVLSDPSLLSYLKDHLLAQDDALGQLVNRLTMETLTRPLHQPIRYCAQGTPATGKSESALLLAKKLDISYVNIDAASMPDYHTAASQLLGSGRGIVMSHQAGRLEQAAKHHTGALVEVSDLDHSVPSVRSALADLFLQTLETGEAQSAIGAMFSCANIIFAFTMNLPGGMDEAVRKGIGFCNAPTRQDVQKRVVSEIKMLLSSAFLSRIGTPILFEPLSGDALAAILEHAVKKAILSAAKRLHAPVRQVMIEEGLGMHLMADIESSIASFGARAILEHGRSLAAKALVEFTRGNNDIQSASLRVAADPHGKVVITKSD